MRQPLRNGIAIALVAVLLAAPLVAAAGPQAQQDGKRIVLSNDDITVRFDAGKPSLQVLPTSAPATASPAFTLTFDQIVEYRNVGGSGSPSAREVVQRLDLTDASQWHANLSSSAGLATVNLSLTAPVKPQSTPAGLLDNLTSALPQKDAVVSLVFTARDAAASVGDVLALQPAAVAMQLEILQWPFVDASMDRLALDAHVSGNATRLAAGGVVTLAVATNATQAGVVAWEQVANGTGADGSAIPVPVVDVEQRDAANATTSFDLTYDASSLSAVRHDAGVALAAAAIEPLSATGTLLAASQQKSSPGAGAALTVGAALAAVVAIGVVKRRR